MNAPAAVPPKQRKPDWIRVKAPVSEGYHATRRLMRDLNLATVCEEAACPNIGECWTKKHATVMILGDTCTRACAFCNVKTGMPRAVDPLEPEHVATAAAPHGHRPPSAGQPITWSLPRRTSARPHVPESIIAGVPTPAPKARADSSDDDPA
jgi:hypothetical protein